jgi:catechol 2,3-dioxygenase-like lactoylglutathione lyase family enzyme
MTGIHHVTAISGKAQRNLDFYRRVMGLRLVKKAVNFDDPGTYHLCYRDAVGYAHRHLTRRFAAEAIKHSRECREFCAGHGLPTLRTGVCFPLTNKR